jgi:large subunit ribosomal protein L4
MNQKKNIVQPSATNSVQVLALHDFGIDPSVVSQVSPRLYANYVRVLRQNWRQGTVACKGRSDVSFSNRKPWKQKGTGRARAGDFSSPLFRKGGVTFGPQPRTRTLSMPTTMRRLVFKELFHSALAEGKVLSIQGDSAHVMHTRDARLILKNAGLWNKKIVLFTTMYDMAIQAAFGNIPEVTMYLFDQPNAYALSDTTHLVYFEKDIDLFKQMVQAWI